MTMHQPVDNVRRVPTISSPSRCQAGGYLHGCRNPARVWMYGPRDTNPIPGPLCREHAAEFAAEYHEKLGEFWPIEYARIV